MYKSQFQRLFNIILNYIHNYISLILFCSFTIINYFIFRNFKNIKLISLLSLIPNLVDGLLCCYMKYLIDKKYHSYWNVLFFIGLFYYYRNIGYNNYNKRTI